MTSQVDNKATALVAAMLCSLTIITPCFGTSKSNAFVLTYDVPHWMSRASTAMTTAEQFANTRTLIRLQTNQTAIASRSNNKTCTERDSLGVSFSPSAPTCAQPTTCSQTVTGIDALRSALKVAKCGCEIVATGTFSGDFILRASCLADNPAVVKGDGATFTDGTFIIENTGGMVAGMVFNGTTLRIDGDGNRVSGNIFARPQRPAVKVIGSFNRIDYNEIGGASTSGIEISLKGGAARNRGNRVDHNYIHDSHATGNGGESIRILTDKDGMAGAVIEYNLMERVSVPGEGEAVSIKTGGNIIRGNTLRDSPHMGIVNRNGNANIYSGNFISGSGGLRLHGDGNRAIGNVVEGQIRVMAGNRYQILRERACLPGMEFSTANGACTHAVAQNTVLEDNQASVVIGFAFDSSHAPALDTTVSRNCGDVIQQSEVGTIVTAGTCSPTAKELEAGDVGPRGLAAACPQAH